MNILPSRYVWNKFKDTIHFYVVLGLIPVGLVITYSNIFIGPAQLQPIPEGYHPKHWEYHRVSDNFIGQPKWGRGKGDG